jgi:hypothetical protein
LLATRQAELLHEMREIRTSLRSILEKMGAGTQTESVTGVLREISKSTKVVEAAVETLHKKMPAMEEVKTPKTLPKVGATDVKGADKTKRNVQFDTRATEDAQVKMKPKSISGNKREKPSGATSELETWIGETWTTVAKRGGKKGNKVGGCLRTRGLWQSPWKMAWGSRPWKERLWRSLVVYLGQDSGRARRKTRECMSLVDGGTWWQKKGIR